MFGEIELSEENKRLFAILKTLSLVAFVISAVMLPVIAGTADLSLRLVALTLMFASGALWLLTSLGEGKIVLPRWTLVISGGAVVIAGIISALTSDCPQTGIVTWIQWLGYISAFTVAFWAGSIAHVRTRLIRVLCALALPIAVYALLQQAFFMDWTLEELKNKKEETIQSQGLSEQDYQALVLRASSKRVPSTFAISNSLAAFLILLLPPAIVLAASAPGRKEKIILAGAAVLMAGGLFVTYSKGGWAAAALVAIAFVAVFGLKVFRENRKSLFAVLGAVAVLLIAIVSIRSAREQLAGIPADFARSFKTRGDYWAAAIKMWEDSPALGVGPGNFQNHYMKYKPAEAEETKAVHNDYIQLLAECGPAAAIGYAAFWLFLLIYAARKIRASEPLPLAEPVSKDAIMISAIGGIIIAAVTGLPFYISQNPLINFGAPVVFIALWYLMYRMSARIDGKMLSAGLFLGVLGFALHSFVDLNLYTDGVAIIAFAAAGLLASDVAPGKTILPGKKSIILIILLLPLALGVFWASSRVSGATATRTYGIALARDGNADSLKFLDEAIRKNPLDHESFAAKADLLAAVGGPQLLEDAIEGWRKAIALNPSFADYHYLLAKSFVKAAKTNQALAGRYIESYNEYYGATKLPAPLRQEYIPAIAEAFRATQLAPNQPQYRMILGESLISAGIRESGIQQLKTALELNERMKAAGTPFRQHLTKDDVDSIKKKLNLTLE